MEEKEKALELAIIAQVIKLGGSLPMEAWIAAILAKTAATEKSLNELAHFDSKIEKTEFRRLVDNLRFCDSDVGCVFVSCIHYGDDSVTVNLRLGNPGSSFYLLGESCLKKFLLGLLGFGWEEIARKIWEQLEKALPIVSKIRRDILYPEVAEEVAEMKKENNFLKSQLAEKEKELGFMTENRDGANANYNSVYSRLREAESQLAEIHDALELCVNVEKNKDDFRRYFPSKNPENSDSDAEKLWNIFVGKCEIKIQIAEKEKEIGELKKDWERKLVQWRGKLDSICSQLINTKSIFKSKRIADIRNQTMKLDWEVWEAYCTISSNPLPPPINLFRIQPPEPWPRLQECDTCNGTREIPCPACGDLSEEQRAMGVGESCACCKGKREIKCPDCDPLTKKPKEPEIIELTSRKR